MRAGFRIDARGILLLGRTSGSPIVCQSVTDRCYPAPRSPTSAAAASRQAVPAYLPLGLRLSRYLVVVRS